MRVLFQTENLTPALQGLTFPTVWERGFYDLAAKPHTGNRSSARWAVLVVAGGIQVDKLAAGLQESAFSAS